MKLARNILLVDDEASWLRTLSITLNRLVPEAKIDTCVDSRQVMNRLEVSDYALVLLDLTMPFHSGEELLDMIRNAFPNTRVIIVTGVNEVDTAVRCIKHGAYDYFIKTDNVNDLARTVRRALEVVGLERNYLRIKESFLSKTLSQPEAFNNILTCEPSLIDQFRYFEAVAPSPEPILIQGESGTGKDEFAKSGHLLCCPDAPFVNVNLVGISTSAFELQLFGQIKTLENGQVSAQAGVLHQVQSGLLYLNEIGDLPIEAQAKLVDVIEHKQYYPIGSDKAYPVLCKIITSTQHDLLALSKAGKFRNDLLYRLRSHTIKLPPLRQRRLDLFMLINHFITLAADEMNLSRPQQPSSLAAQLAEYEFPGNLHELKGMVFDAVSRSDGIQLNITPFMEAINLNKAAPDDKCQLVFPKELPTLAQMGDALINEAMSRTANSQTAAARMLGISQSALSRRLKQDK
ncbi:sigma-54-dependent Fis family transcriptional regulator [Shewanella sp. Choline-02u-19]|uniref:sigma-54-dependent transcriptional regulator n=1 Tax=unclassified Shewanella TaxID=196818 RepID=UPI000C32ADA6|nr:MULTISPECIES: sigma 54-interacting transcriptional regulator [unclassified Shewanella]PKG55989.1 sigma-54-dependent Fis family transcriptional regulator [Shewanella sp. GutDb-MelDb]PKG74102.1 sigma-54-dependent Fis family transcriptional regulator [Shewanella sp. GutCb]PKH56443.1 sigma-54-dependent Fis family transcriptional regulator [Shewanella sp. Bg11-22]PKI30002.1 sigma-54-dependent Fis family transcriptional regulator [Shewanella sp. Choline-02u-19]